MSVLLGNGNGTFQAQATFAAGSFPYSVAVGDVNGDGRPDLLVANGNSNNVSVLLGNGNGNFTGQVYTQPHRPPGGGGAPDDHVLRPTRPNHDGTGRPGTPSVCIWLDATTATKL